jgi:hypothetical protein
MYWNILFALSAIIEFIPGLAVMTVPSILFPGINSSGNLASKWWSSSVISLGLLNFLVCGTLDGSESKTIVAIIMAIYNLSIGTMTIIRLIYKQQVDGPQKSIYDQTRNRNNGILGIFIHFTLAIIFEIYIYSFQISKGLNDCNIIFVVILTICSITTSLLTNTNTTEMILP